MFEESKVVAHSLHEAIPRTDPEIQRGCDTGAAPHSSAIPGGNCDLVDVAQSFDGSLTDP